MAQDVDTYFKSGFHQLRCAPRLIIPFLISSAISYASVWAIMFIFVLVSLPVLGNVIPILEKNQELISEIITNKSAGNYADTRIQEMEKDFSGLFPEMIPYLIFFLVALCIIIIIAYILYAWAQAGTVGYAWQGITGSLDFKNFRYYAGRNFRRIAGLWTSIIIFSIILFLIPFAALVLIPSPASIILFLLLLPAVFVIWVIAMLFLFFAEECIVIEDKGIAEAIRRSREVAAGNLGSILLFILISFSVMVIYGIISFTFELIAGIFNSNLSTTFELFSLVILVPWISLAKINFFLDRTGRDIMVMEKEIEVVKELKELLKASPGILFGFVKNNTGYVLAALCFFAGGFGAGYHIGNSFSFLSDEFTLALKEYMKDNLLGPYNSLPFIDVLYYFSNNSMVALNQGLSGIFFVLPSILGLVVNGIMIGVFYGVLPATVASAFIALHGVFEVAAFVIATAAGIKLGVRFMKGSADQNEILDEILKVLLASFLLIGIAAVLEAFITPVVTSLGI